MILIDSINGKCKQKTKEKKVYIKFIIKYSFTKQFRRTPETFRGTD